VTRVIWLDGLEAQNKNAHARGIYIHGTPEESKIGTPASYGCIRMRSKDVIQVFNAIPVGTVVSIIPSKLPHMRRYQPPVEQPEPESQVAQAAAPAAKADASPAKAGGMIAMSKAAPAKSIEFLTRSAVAPLLPPIGESSERSNTEALREMKGSILLANLPTSDSDRRGKSSQDQ
jgi:hypothetical protein